MAIELHWLSGSPYAWRVQLALEIKGLRYVSHTHQLSTGELKKPEYLALNPRGRVPTLADDGFVIYESLAILAYLDRKYPEPPLFGTTPEAVGLIWQMIAEYTSYMDHAVESFILPLYFGKTEEKADSIRKAAAKLHAELDYLNRRLTQSDYLVGKAMTAADIVVFPHIKSIERAASKPAALSMNFGFLPFGVPWPAIDRWLKRIEELEGYERTYPPHWRG
jgi:glutathione S-transferase